MIQLFYAPIFDKIRLLQKIKNVLEQLWGKRYLMVTSDMVSFNPPEADGYKFPGHNLHWDVSLKQPIPFGIQGLSYLSETEENQGAFSPIPGFHHMMDQWLKDIHEHPRKVPLKDHFEVKSIAGKAGDLIIRNHCLPHGSSPNLGSLPRIVQYINHLPLDLEYQEEWI